MKCFFSWRGKALNKSKMSQSDETIETIEQLKFERDILLRIMTEDWSVSKECQTILKKHLSHDFIHSFIQSGKNDVISSVFW